MKLPTGDSSFFPTYFRTERGKDLVIQPISLIKDHELRRRIDTAVERGPGLSIALGAHDIYKAMAIGLTDAGEQLFDIAAFIFDVTPDFIGNELSLAEIIEVIMSCIYEPTEASDVKRVEDGDVWTFSRVIDFFGKEYSWTIPNVMAMSRHQLKTVVNAVEERQKAEEQAMDEARDGRDGRHSSAADRMNNSKFINRAKGKAHRRKPMETGSTSKPEPDWNKSEGSNSLLMFAHTLGIPIKKEGSV